MSEKKVKAPNGYPETAKPIPPIAGTQAPEPDPEPETASPQKAPASAPIFSAEADHLLDLPTGEEPEGGDAGEPVEPAAVQLSRDEFWGLFRGLFQMGRAFTGLESFGIAPGETERARAASDALYEIADETPSLKWLLAPDAPWMQRSVVILAFVGPKALSIRSELRMRRAADPGDESEPRTHTFVSPETNNQASGGRADNDDSPGDGAVIHASPAVH